MQSPDKTRGTGCRKTEGLKVHLETGLLLIDLAALQAASKQESAETLPGNLLLISSGLSHLSQATLDPVCVLKTGQKNGLFYYKKEHVAIKYTRP